MSRWMPVIIACVLLAASSDLLAQAAPATTQATGRFIAIDVTLDPRGQPLAAYQVEIAGDQGRVELVGVEGGEHGAFSEPPYYDPVAVGGERIIIAALAMDRSAPPVVVTRIARLHLRLAGDDPLKLAVRNVIAATPDERRIDVRVELKEVTSP